MKLKARVAAETIGMCTRVSLGNLKDNGAIVSQEELGQVGFEPGAVGVADVILIDRPNATRTWSASSAPMDTEGGTAAARSLSC